MAEFAGDIVHPQHWPAELDCKDKRVVVIGSGATAMTLAPALVERGARVTMVQRSPTYVVSAPDPDPLNEVLRRWLPAKWAHALTRRRNIALQGLFYRWARRRPRQVTKFLLKRVCKQLGLDDTVQPLHAVVRDRGTNAYAWCRTPICSEQSVRAAWRW